MNRPLITLCMIVRDEAELLPRFLACAAGSYDELCVVDTGSKDESIRLLKDAGATVWEEPWRDDFAAARNVGLAHARGEWIVQADADEMFSPELVREIRIVCENAQAGAATVVMRNELPNGRIHRASLLRIFRNDPMIRFRFPIHEDVSDSVASYLKKTGRKLVHLASHADHLGYVRARAAARDKRHRDKTILEKSLATDPADLYCWYKLLELARFWDDRPLWCEKAVAAAKAIQAAPAEVLRHVYFGGELVALIADGLYPAEPNRALEVMNEWHKRTAPAAAFYLRRAELYERCHDHASAKADFETCLTLEDERDHERVTVRPLLGLSRIELANGKIDGAKALVDSAVKHNHRDPEALLAYVALARIRGGASAIERATDTYQASYGDTTELHQALGEEALLSGDFQSAIKEFSLVCNSYLPGQASLRLAQALLANGDIERCRVRIGQIVSRFPEAALGLLICDLVENRDSKIDVDLEQDQASQALRDWLEILRQSPDRRLRAMLKQNLPLVSEIFPWVVQYLSTIKA
jgi:glycosyltransferase involved in cell wall biosynthesis